jgi:DNA ligase-associated metallophosphoesterase
MMPLDASIAGEPVRLDARRALFWPRWRWLLVADLHLGKASLLRQAGAALPLGTTTRDLDRLAALVAAYAPSRLIVLGDLVHGRERADAPWLQRFAQWRCAHAALPLTLVAGNHDRHMAVADLGVDVVDEIDAAPFVLRHAPELHAGLHVIAGHVHPMALLRDGRARHRLPAFWLGPRRSILPAFGTLCGLTPREAETADRVVAVTPGGVIELARRPTSTAQNR